MQKKAATDPAFRDCNLIFDSMHIKARAEYSKAAGTYLAFVDYGPFAANEGRQDVPATEALVFLLIGLPGKWKIPIGYALVEEIQAKAQARLAPNCTVSFQVEGALYNLPRYT